MKTLPKFCFVALLLSALAGCRDVGYNGKTFNNASTSDVSQKAYTRTYDQNGTPIVTPAPVPGANDPASPTYHSANGAN